MRLLRPLGIPRTVCTSSHVRLRLRQCITLLRPTCFRAFATREEAEKFRKSSVLDNLREKLRSSKQQQQQPLILRSLSDNPFHNLAIENYLLQNTDPDSKVLFFYTNRPCVVIGRNQNPWVECDHTLLQAGIDGQPCQLLRRRSGGGTVFHDEGNLNFSFILPNDQSFSREGNLQRVVESVKTGVRELTALKNARRLWADLWVNARHDISMRAIGSDAVYKISGSAFKLIRGRALHHGTILHSSPNLPSISKLLNGPGRRSIKARGVESVRSSVNNLFAPQHAEERVALGQALMFAIARDFGHSYGYARNMDSLEEVVTVGDMECDPLAFPEIAAGVCELMSDDWRFGQTPRFEALSPADGDDTRLKIEVNRGILEKVLLITKDDERLQHDMSDRWKGQELEQFRRFVTSGRSDLAETVVSWFNEVFPPTLLNRDAVDPKADPVIQSTGKVVIRQSRDSIEVESGSSTVENRPA